MVNLLVCRRNFYLTLILILMVFNYYGFSQNSVDLVFTGRNQQNSYIRLSGVTIQNISKDWSETIFFPDTIYTLNIGMGIEEISQEDKMQVMPNPFDGNTRVNVFSTKAEMIRMQVVDINGKKHAEYSGNIIAGDNVFVISLTTPQVYILQVISTNGIRSLKMVNKGHAGVNRITSAGNMEKMAKIDLKSYSTHSFDLGDEMQYMGYAQVGNQMVEGIPIRQMQYASEHIILVFESGSLSVSTDSILFPDNSTMLCYGTANSYGIGVTNTGFCWDIFPNPTLANNYTDEGPIEGGFTSVITGLDPSQAYYVRAYASNNAETVYGNEIYCYPAKFVVNDTVFLPDGVDCGNGCAYESHIDVTGYAASDVIESENDIKYVRAKLEHTYIGDIYVALTCPSDPVTGVRRSAKILKKYGNHTTTECSDLIPSDGWGWNLTSGIGSAPDFGAALHTDQGDDCDPSTNPMGTAWNYCWSNNTANGYLYANGQGYVYESVNQGHHLSGSVDSSNMTNMTNIYHPDESFASLIGCPMNGTWSITVIDSWYGDNGYFTEWELAFDKSRLVGDATIVDTIVNPCLGIAEVTDYDGNVYHSVAIGSQCWLRENMQTTRYANGEPINFNSSASTTTASYYLPEYPDMYMAGYLYNWNAVMHGESTGSTNSSYIQGICPTGWHVPSDEEWSRLTAFLRANEEYVCGGNTNNIAKSLAINTAWNESSNFCAVGNDLFLNNSTGFTAFPSGYVQGTSMGYGQTARFWSSTPYNDAYAYYHTLNYDNSWVVRSNSGDKTCGMSVRCVLAEVPKVTLISVGDITDTSAVGNGKVTDTGGAPVIERGFCWSTGTNPTLADYHVACGTGGGSFAGLMTGLAPGTTYYVRAYATNSSGTSYGNQATFVTLNVPTVTTNTVTDIMDSSATCGGNVTSDGGDTVSLLVKGICWSTSQNPTIYDSMVTDTSAQTNYTCIMTGLIPGTTYYVRAFATNSVGTTYGTQRNFTTKNTPTVTLDSATNIMSISASCTYHITADGGMNIIGRGVCYSTSPNPTLSDSLISSTGNTGTVQLSNLTPGTIYYVRAYATNSIGTAYSNEISFTTQTIPSLTTANVDNISFFTAMAGGEVLATGVPQITARGVCWSTSQHPTLNDNHTTDGGGFGTFTSQMTGLNLNTRYYVRAYATNSSGTDYGNQVTFVTLNVPSVTTKTVANITDSSATCGGNVTSNGGSTASLLAKGICWSTSQNPTINDSMVTDTSAQTNYTCVMTGLIPGTTYYVRAFATNGGGIAYGTQRNFTTKTIPSVTTNTVSSITSTTAICGGNVTATGGASVTARGVCWSTSQNPTVSDSHTINGTGTGSFTSSMTGLTLGTTYYVRAYATNGVGTSYGEQRSFTTVVADGDPCPGASTVIDYDNNIYNTVQIGNQCWMKENLRTTHYANGESVSLGTSTSTTTPYRYNPDNNSNNVPTYGYLYNWPAVMHGTSSSSANPSGVQGICPIGWHVPSDAEWTQLTDYVGSQTQYQCGNNSENIAKALASTTGWYSNTNTCAVGNNPGTNNATVFSALPAGGYLVGDYYYFGYYANFWSATEDDVYDACYRSLSYKYAYVGRYGHNKYTGFSVRCVRDQSRLQKREAPKRSERENPQ